MRVEGSVTTISWVPAEAVERDAKTGFRLGTPRADPAPPADLGPDIDTTLDALADRYRFANHLRGFAEFDDDGEVRRYGEQGSGRLGHRAGREGAELAIGTIPMPERRGEPVVGPGWVRFDQTWGGRTASTMAKATLRPPFVRFNAPVAWTTLELTLHADGRVRRTAGRRVALPAPLGLRRGRSPRRDERHHGLEGLGRFSGRDAYAVGRRGLAGLRHRGRVGVGAGAGRDAVARHPRPAVRRLQAGEVLTRQGDPGDDLYVIVDGVLVVSVDGTEVVELGPGAVLGERAVLQGGRRTGTLTAGTRPR